MRSERIEEILTNHGLTQSKELAAALEQILKEYSRDPQLSKNIQQDIERKTRLDMRMNGLR